MHERSECADAAPPGNIALCAINPARSHENVRDSSLLAVLTDELLLPDFGETVSLAAKLRMFVNWTRLVQNPSVRFFAVRVNGERTDQHKSSQAPKSQAGLK